MTQVDLDFSSYTRCRARSTDPVTSHEAAWSVTNLSEKQDAVLLVMRLGGEPYAKYTDDDLLRVYPRLMAQYSLPQQSPSGLRTRRSELTSKGLVIDTGLVALTPSGRKATVWRAR